MDRRVVITGIGAVTCVGNNVLTSWDSLVNGRSGITKVTRFDASRFKTQIAGEVKNFDFSPYMSEKEARRLDLFCHYAIAASDEAITMAGISKDLSGLNPEKVGVLVGSGIGGLRTLEDQSRLLFERGPEKISPLLIPMMIGDMASGSISMRYGAKGPNFGIVTACATACHSIGEASWIIKRGDADVMICGGAEATIVPIGFAGFCSMKAMSTRNDEPEKA
ncbi:MAG TPA: beta-ketoacyl synthase N-terminal-like domain-containing protein, partial [Victivallales bacterium]|nr:beta-ketoacyl synthase N-terminal-like domain-containing protein [Victivallales bacterium]